MANDIKQDAIITYYVDGNLTLSIHILKGMNGRECISHLSVLLPVEDVIKQAYDFIIDYAKKEGLFRTKADMDNHRRRTPN